MKRKKQDQRRYAFELYVRMGEGRFSIPFGSDSSLIADSSVEEFLHREKNCRNGTTNRNSMYRMAIMSALPEDIFSDLEPGTQLELRCDTMVGGSVFRSESKYLTTAGQVRDNFEFAASRLIGNLFPKDGHYEIL